MHVHRYRVMLYTFVDVLLFVLSMYKYLLFHSLIGFFSQEICFGRMRLEFTKICYKRLLRELEQHSRDTQLFALALDTYLFSLVRWSLLESHSEEYLPRARNKQRRMQQWLHGHL